MSLEGFIGREKELAELRKGLERALEGKGNTILISGEAGLGKTTLIREFLASSSSDTSDILMGTALDESSEPFQIFSRALGESAERPLFEDHEYRSFTELFAVDRAGILVGQAAPEDEGLDGDIFAGMLSAVQDFVRDSFDRSTENKNTLGRLEYGNMKIIIEHGDHLFLTAVFTGSEHENMKSMVRNSLDRIESKYGHILENWSGSTEDIKGIQDEIVLLAQSKFLVRKSLEGISLEQERTRISEEVLEALHALSDDKSMILLLEDLQWADESSIFVLNYISRNIRNRKIMILGTLRPREGKQVLDSLEDVKDDGGINILDLGKFNEDNIEDLAFALFPNNRFPKDFLADISSQSGGNPFFASELLRSLEDTGSIVKKEGKYYLDDDNITMPDTIEAVVQHRLEVLDTGSLALMEFASCVGKEFDRKVLLTSNSLKDPGSSIEKLGKAGIFVNINDIDQFSHAMFQSIVYDSLPDRWKMLYHKEIGEWYEKEYASKQDEVIYELARHFSNSREHTKSFDYSRLAGEKAESSFSPDLATEFYLKAVDAIPKMKLGPLAREHEFMLLERVGEMKGLLGSFESSLETYSKALDAADDDGSKARIHRRRAYIMTMHGQFDDALAELTEAEELLEEIKHDEMGFLMIARSFVNLNKGHFDDTISMAQNGIEILEDVDSIDAKKTAGRAWKILGVCHLLMGNHDESLRCHDMGKKMGEELNDLYGLSAAYNNIGNVYLAKGSFLEAMKYYEEALELLEKTKDLQGKSYTLNNIGIIRKNMGDFDKALEYYEECLRIMEKTGDPSGMASSLNNIGNVLAEQERHEEAIVAYDKALKIARDIGDKQQIVNNLTAVIPSRVALGQMEKAAADCEAGITLSLEIGSKRTEIWGLRAQGMIHAAKGQKNKACDCLELAASTFGELGMEAEAAKTLFEHGILLLKDEGNEEGRRLIEEAKEIFERSGMVKMMKDCDALLDQSR